MATNTSFGQAAANLCHTPRPTISSLAAPPPSHNGCIQRIWRNHPRQGGEMGVCHCHDIRWGRSIHSTVLGNLHQRRRLRVFHVRLSGATCCQHSPYSILVRQTLRASSSSTKHNHEYCHVGHDPPLCPSTEQDQSPVHACAG
uniref:Uncharacterized protein n=1 Tax=Cacopsylla melanoneura TaxID=428564 RepID=A0A8D8RHC6_9HEMI